MTHVVTELCFDCKHTDCVAVCPVDCFHEDERTLWIDPDECIDCGACIPECPEEAIFLEADVPEQYAKDIALNAEMSRKLPVIVETREPLMGRDGCKKDDV
jgi:ferredoxin